MSHQSLDVFNSLLLLARDLHISPDRAAAVYAMDVNQTCYRLYDIDVIEEAFLSAASRSVERYALASYRLNVEHGIPSFFYSIGYDTDHARNRLAKWITKHHIETEIDE